MFRLKRTSRDKKVTDVGKTIRIVKSDFDLSYRVGNLQKIGARSAQEDSFTIINALDVNEISSHGLYAIVADGMGGMKDGKLVSEAAIQGFVHAFYNLNLDMDIPSQLEESVREVNHNLYDRFEGEGGTTIVSILLYKGMAYWVSVGDSSIYLKREGGLFKLNIDHTYKNQLYLEEIYIDNINKDVIENNKDGVRLSEFLGSIEINEIDYNKKPLRLKKDDIILLCSDGISSFIDENSIYDALTTSPDISCQKLERMIEEKSAKNQDNYTAIVISCLN